ncbi:hypothetical protein KHF85_03185 [Xanthomonas translucens pv. graminis]|uniref:hypothetical protein n=1 Tax=Xanthomonas graminis TaxID=3390026 RepID=UPI002541DC86|nr:hypothetical protein [Xanthomonas translucens]WIH05520.1 hypothetical protein KHF85_03185 [Xanthomonas translucens pv. graminis]
MTATIHQFSPDVDRLRLLQNALDTNSAGLFLMRLYFERLDCFGEHDSYTKAFEMVTRAIRESVRRDRELYDGSDIEAQMERLKYLSRIDAHSAHSSGTLSHAIVVQFPAERIVRRRKAKKLAVLPTDQPFRFSKRAADAQPAITQDREKAR